MSIEANKNYFDSKAYPERKTGHRLNWKKVIRNLGAVAGVAIIAKAGSQFGGEIVQNAQDLLTHDNGIKIEQAFNEYASENMISSELVAVFVESGDSVEKLCKNNMTYEDDNQPNWGEFTNYVENLKENKELFAEGRVLQPGDELYIPTSYGKVEESPDK